MTKQAAESPLDNAAPLLKSASRQMEIDIRTLDEQLVAEGRPIETVLAESAPPNWRSSTTLADKLQPSWSWIRS